MSHAQNCVMVVIHVMCYTEDMDISLLYAIGMQRWSNHLTLLVITQNN